VKGLNAGCLRTVLIVGLTVVPLCGGTARGEDGAIENSTAFALDSTDLWQPSTGFSGSAQTFTVAPAGVLGFVAFGGREAHDLGLLSVSYGHMLGGVGGAGRWYHGNWELRAELFGGAQVSGEPEWLVGLTPHLRYNFVSGTSFIPFVDAGAGVSATSIGPPDLSGTFEFNIQAGVGTHYLLSKTLALTLEARVLHMSCAGIHKPNQGINGLMGVLGVTCVF